jgi:hypothetical protein
MRRAAIQWADVGVHGGPAIWTQAIVRRYRRCGHRTKSGQVVLNASDELAAQ